MPAPTMRATFDALYDDRLPYLEELIYKGYEEHPDEFAQVFNVRSSERMRETDYMVSTFGQYPVKLEGADIVSDSMEASYYKHFTHTTYAKGVDITMEALEDDQDDLLNDTSYELGFAARVTQETLAFNEGCNNGFTTALAADGAAIYGAHTTAAGIAWNNSGAVDLDVPGLQQALTHFGNLVDERGKQIRLQAATLIVPPELQYDAIELVESIQRPDTSDNAVNAFRHFNLSVFVCHFLTSQTAWFVWADPRVIKAKWYWRKRPQVISDVDYRSQNGLTAMLWRSSVGVSDPRGLWGSTGS